MKILLLNPHIDAQHKVAAALQLQGHAVLFAGNAEEAWQMVQLHDTNLDLAILHREGIAGKDDGIDLVARLKQAPQYADLPVILTSEVWGDAEFGAHQQTPHGVNAYLHWPFEPEALSQVMDQIFGQPPAQGPAVSESVPSLGLGAEPSLLATPAAEPSIFPPAAGDPGEGGTLFGGTIHASGESAFTLEDASGVFTRPEAQQKPGDDAIQLDSPVDAAAALAGTGMTTQLPAAEAPMEGSAEIALPTAMSQRPSLDAEPPVIDAGGNFTTDEASVQPLDISAIQPASETLSETVPEEASETGSETELGVLGPNVPPPKDPTRMAKAPGPRPKRKAKPVYESNFSEEPAPTFEAPNDDELSKEMAGEMPYLFSSKPAPELPASSFEQPIGDAVVPGGAANAPDTDTLKKYLLLREQDVAALSAQLKTARQEIDNVKNLLREEHAKNAELTHLCTEQKIRLEDYERTKQQELDTLSGEMDELRFQARTKTDKARVLENQVREAGNEIERLKERVRSDLRKIRVREKELENRLEIVKKDSEALLLTRENKIIELKRKVDLLEFNMDLLQDQYMREKETTAKLRERLSKAAQVVRVAGGLLDQNKEKGGEGGGSEPGSSSQGGGKAREAS